MATGKQHVKTPSGWNATQGAWVKTGSTTWKAVDQIYVKTPAGWNNASGQTSVQQPYPYIANAQTPVIANGQQPYPYIANAQTPSIANGQQPYPYIANAQTPSIANAQQPYPYQANAQTPSIANGQQPYPYIANSQTPYIANARQPFTYRNPVNGQQPYIANGRNPFTYRNPVNGQQPYIANGQTPFTYNARYPANAQSPSNGQTPFTYNARTPFTYNARYPANGQQPYIANGRTPLIYQARLPFPYPYTQFFGGFGGFGCFVAGSQVWMGDNRHVNIEDVKVGDSVMSFCEEHMKLMPQNVLTVMTPRENIKVWDVELSNGRTLGVTGGHPIHTRDGWKYVNQEECDNEIAHGADWGVELVGEMQVGDEVFAIGEEGVTVKSITDKGTATVYHLTTVENTKTYFVDGVLVHNGFGSKF